MCVLKSLILVQVSKKIFGITNKREVQISIWWRGVEKKLASGRTFIWYPRAILFIIVSLNRDTCLLTWRLQILFFQSKGA